MRFQIGQHIWVGDFSPLAPFYEKCPDCGGTGRLRVIFHDETQVSIECRNCSAGYDHPTGRIIVHRNKASARQATICGLEINDGRTRWHIDGLNGCYRIVEDEAAFDNEADAFSWAESKAAAYEEEQRARIQQKEKDTRSWAWNASYHRRAIEKAKKDIAYHTEKLNVAALKAKVPEGARP